MAQPASVPRMTKRLLLNQKPMLKIVCQGIIKKYPQLEDKFEYLLAPHLFTEPVELEFSLPIKQTKTIKFRGKEITVYIPEFWNFNFEVEVLRRAQ